MCSLTPNFLVAHRYRSFYADSVVPKGLGGWSWTLDFPTFSITSIQVQIATHKIKKLMKVHKGWEELLNTVIITCLCSSCIFHPDLCHSFRTCPQLHSLFWNRGQGPDGCLCFEEEKCIETYERTNTIRNTHQWTQCIMLPPDGDQMATFTVLCGSCSTTKALQESTVTTWIWIQANNNPWSCNPHWGLTFNSVQPLCFKQCGYIPVTLHSVSRVLGQKDIRLHLATRYTTICFSGQITK